MLLQAGRQKEDSKDLPFECERRKCQVILTYDRTQQRTDPGSFVTAHTEGSSDDEGSVHTDSMNERGGLEA